MLCHFTNVLNPLEKEQRIGSDAGLNFSEKKRKGLCLKKLNRAILSRALRRWVTAEGGCAT